MNTHLRAATRDDAAHIAALINIAGGDLPRTLWARWGDYGQDPMDVGRVRAMRDVGILTWKHATMVEVNGEIAGTLITHSVGATPATVTSDTHPVMRPLSRLENLVPHTRHINVVAVYPEVRRRGIGSALIAAAEERPGPNGMSLIITDQNRAGRAFLHALGYEERERVPIVHGDWETDSEEWILLTKA